MREKQIAWLQSMIAAAEAMAKELTVKGDALLPRGFALGHVNLAAEKIQDVIALLAAAVDERER